MNRTRELGVVLGVGIVLAIVLTWPLARHAGSVGRVDIADGQFSIWNVAWVARTLVVDPLHVYDANIFYPHRGTLAYSENNLGAGALAVPVYWLTHGNPYAALNFVVLLEFALAATGMYYLARYLLESGSSQHASAETRAAAAVSAIAFAFCPYIFARTAHIQLMMTAGLPFSMLAFHRMVDRPGTGRGAVLGACMAAEAICCGYYGVFLILMIGFAVVVFATTRGYWTHTRFWASVAVAAIVAIVIVGPLFLPYVRLQRVSGFGRPLDDARRYSADWRAYLASATYAHAWMLAYLRHWNEVLFPGFVAILFGVIGVAAACLRRRGELAVLYGGLALLAVWASFGPDAGLYTVLYRTVPLFTWLRAPARFGLVVAFALALLAGFGVLAMARWFRRPAVFAAIIAAATACELAVKLEFPTAPPVSPAYTLLATLPRGVVIELPFYYPEVGLFNHARYMLASTGHWMPMVNGYSDYIPPDFLEHVKDLAPFPSRHAFKILEPDHVRYAVFHMYGYNDINRAETFARLKEFEANLRPLYVDEQTRLYEIVSYPR